MAIYLHEKNAKLIQQGFTKESVIMGLLSNQYSFSGVKTVKISTLQTVPMGNYTRSGTTRYGTPTEMQDTQQELTLSQDKAFALTIDKGNNLDQQGIKAAGRALALQIKEQAVPTMDAYVLNRLATLAGKIYGVATNISVDNVCDRISTGTVYLDDAEVPDTNRTLLVSATVYKYLRLSDEFLNVDKLAVKSLVKGQVGMYDNMRVVKVPSGRWPSGVNFMIVYKNSGCAPVKLNDTKLHKDPPGISGNLLEGRQYYDCFVFGAKADGIYVDVDTDVKAIAGAPVITAAGGAITEGDATTIYYTTDGTDPRYSVSRATIASGSAPSNHAAGLVVKAYCERTGYYPSAVTTQTLTS